MAPSVTALVQSGIQWLKSVEHSNLRLSRPAHDKGRRVYFSRRVGTFTRIRVASVNGHDGDRWRGLPDSHANWIGRAFAGPIICRPGCQGVFAVQDLFPLKREGLHLAGIRFPDEDDALFTDLSLVGEKLDDSHPTVGITNFRHNFYRGGRREC